MLGNSTIWNALAEMPRKLSCKLELSNSNTITDVKLLTYNSDWTGNITIGQVVSSYINVTVPTPIFALAGLNVTLSMGVTISNAVTWTQIGVFRIDEKSIRTRQGYTSFKAYDKLYGAINSYHSALSYPVTLQNIYAEVCTQIGLTSYPSLTYNPSYTADSEVLEMLDGYNLRDILGFVAAYQGKNAYLSPTGALEFRWFSSASYTADGTKANVPYIGENNSTVARLICQTADGVLTSGIGEGIYFTCPFMGQSRLAAMVSGLSLTYRKADVDIPYGNYCLQSSDIITVTTVQNQTLSVPIMNNSWTYDGGVSSAVSAYDVSDYSGTANNAERSLSVRRVQRQMAVNRATSDLKAASEKITGASGGYIRINFGGDGKTAALLIMDTEDISTAQNVWVFNQGGLGHFPNGYDPTAQANVALTYDGWVVAERISGTLISGVGIENVDNALTTKPKIALSNGCIHFTETYDYSGTAPQVTDIGKLEYLARSSQGTAATLALTCEYGNNISIGTYGYPKFVYISNHGNNEAFRMYGSMKMWDDSGVSALISAQALIDIVDGGKKNLVNSASFSDRVWADIPINIPAGKYTVGFSELTGTASGQSQILFFGDNWVTASEPYFINKGVDVYTENVEITTTATVLRLYASTSSAPSSGQTISYTNAFICAKELWEISPKITPYCPSNKELYDMIQNL